MYFEGASNCQHSDLIGFLHNGPSLKSYWSGYIAFLHQSCTADAPKNLLLRVAKARQAMLRASLRLVFAQVTDGEILSRWDNLATGLQQRFPKAAPCSPSNAWPPTLPCRPPAPSTMASRANRALELRKHWRPDKSLDRSIILMKSKQDVHLHFQENEASFLLVHTLI